MDYKITFPKIQGNLETGMEIKSKIPKIFNKKKTTTTKRSFKSAVLLITKNEAVLCVCIEMDHKRDFFHYSGDF